MSWRGYRRFWVQCFYNERPLLFFFVEEGGCKEDDEEKQKVDEKDGCQESVLQRILAKSTQNVHRLSRLQDDIELLKACCLYRIFYSLVGSKMGLLIVKELRNFAGM